MMAILPPIQIANTQDECQNGAGTVGTNNCMEYEEVEEGGILYLNIENPAQCNGTITQWNYCYYKPDNQEVYQVHLAVYRRTVRGRSGNIHYSRQHSSLLSVEHGDSEEGPDFVCASYLLSKPIAVQQGDFIGICLPQSNSLDVVSDTSGVELHADSLQYIKRDCENDAPGNIPNTSNLSEAHDRIVHLYAHISRKYYSII